MITTPDQRDPPLVNVSRYRFFFFSVPTYSKLSHKMFLNLPNERYRTDDFYQSNLVGLVRGAY